MTFQDKVALITGGGTGIGRSAAESLVALGAKVVINGRREDIWVCPTRLTGNCPNPRPFIDLRELSAFA